MRKLVAAHHPQQKHFPLGTECLREDEFKQGTRKRELCAPKDKEVQNNHRRDQILHLRVMEVYVQNQDQPSSKMT